MGIGLVHPNQVKRNSSAQAGDALILSKPLGVGILSAALKKGQLDASGYAEMLHWTTRLNTPGRALAALPGVHAMTDVTGFGLAGHLLEIARGAGLRATVSFADISCIPRARVLAEQGVATGASARNWESYGSDVHLSDGVSIWQRNLLTDPQTSGGLLISCAQNSVAQVLDLLRADQFAEASVIGHMSNGPAEIRVA